ncbi:SDR family oxidoreductase [Phenylobacterium terrae]|uniref:SDR family oxidoreductase n=1 Tax=Phenylobacterium terrae TaxID=2665495 RepID=A0ABW4N0N9_9CAUL
MGVSLDRDVGGPALAGKTVVVTGASAGVGRAVAQAAARAGANLGLIARSAEALGDVAKEVEALGVRALVLPLDVADAGAVRAAAARVEAELGPIDVWVNAAMATVFSPISRLPAEEVRRVTEVTYLGSVHGILSALDAMRPRGRGVIVQVGSALAFRGIPLQAPYCAAKHAVRGFISSLRSELLHENSPIRITEVHLPAVNTPQFTWARTHLPEEPRPVGTVYRPETAAAAILHAAVHPRRDYWLAGSTLQAILGQALAPALMDRLMARKAWEGQFTGAPAPAERPGNLFAPAEGLHAVRGPFGAEAKGRAILAHGPDVRLAVAAAGAALFTLAGLAAGLRLGRR